MDPSTDTTTVDSLQRSDWPEARRIYLEGIATGQATFETGAPEWEQWDAGHHRFCRLAARYSGALAGWAALSPVSARQCYRGVAEVSLYVGERHRQRGVGRLLLEHVIREAPRHGIWTLQGVTFPENEASVHLQISCGFRLVGRREKIAQLNGIWRDTLLHELRIR